MNQARTAGIPRRGFFALGGAGVAAAALSACGTEIEEPNDERDIEILAAALVGEENAASALKVAQTEAGRREKEAVRALAAQADEHATRLQNLLADLNATPEGEFDDFRNLGFDEALTAAAEQTNAAIAAYARGAGQLTEDFRADVLELIVDTGARQAALAELLGNEPLPFAFVTGQAEKPHQSIGSSEKEEE